MDDDLCFNDINIKSIKNEELDDAISKLYDKENPDSNNGLITSIWGEHAWEYGHSVTFNYPIEPKEEDIKTYYNFFIYFGKTLPCGLCVISYDDFVSNGETKLTRDKLKSRATLVKWFYDIHNKVNEKLGVDYGVSFGELCYKYESYRAKCDPLGIGCRMPLDDKAMSYQKAEIRRSQLVSEDYAKLLIPYAKKLGFEKYEEYLNFFSSIERNSEDWLERDRMCKKIIKHIRKFGINVIGYNDLPLKCELLLNSMLSSSLYKEKRDKIEENINKIFIQ